MGREEDAIVSLIRQIFGEASVPLGIGDDAAVVESGPRSVITADMAVEGIDFTRDIPLRFVGRKSVAANLSDLAAMGAEPSSFLLSLGLPRDDRARVRELLSGMFELSHAVSMALVGGDLSSAAQWIISITAIGRPAERTLLRRGAKPGARIYVSRPLGGSASGLKLFQDGWRIDSTYAVVAATDQLGGQQLDFGAAALRHFVDPLPETRLGMALANDPSVQSCIDISDGLSTDLHRLCSASGVSAVIEWERIPLFVDLERAGRSLGIIVEDAALHGGEEYALLFTSSDRESELSARYGRPVYAIGRIGAGEGVVLERNGARVPLADRGFDHFS